MRGVTGIPNWVIVTRLGGLSYYHRYDEVVKRVVWCANLNKAKRFKCVGDLMEAYSVIPAMFKAFDEDDRFINYPLL